MIDFVLKLVDINEEVCEQFEIQFEHFPLVEVYQSPFELLGDFDCMVSPANSFGLMDGGIDKEIISFLGELTEQRVQRHILQNYFGEQPIGTAFIVPTNHPKHPFLVHAPTMRVPNDINGTTNIYYAMKAMLLSVIYHNQTQKQKIKRVACPGFGTLTGCVSADLAVSQMALAYQHCLYPPDSIYPTFAYQRDREINLLNVDFYK